jgi:riboflavin synthase
VGKEGITGGDDPWGPTARFSIKAPHALAAFIAEKGSVCLDGTSLTVNSVNDDMFSVLIIPHTLSVTTWGDRQVGDKLNLEVDLMARYAARLADARRAE